MANVPTPEFQKLWSNKIECLGREYKDAIQQHSDAGGVMERVHRVLIDIACLVEYTPHSIGESSKWAEVVTNAAETSIKLQHLLKGKQLHGVHAEVLNDLKVVLQESAAKDQATSTPINEPEANEEFRDQRRRKRNSSGNQEKIQEFCYTQYCSKRH
jgi:hypothetical protein